MPQSKTSTRKPTNKKTRRDTPTRRYNKSAKPFVVSIKPDCDYWKPLGLFAGDLVTMTPATDLLPRRIVAVYRNAGALPDHCGFEAGRFLRYESDVEFDEVKGKHPAIVIEDVEGNELTFNLDTWTAYSFTVAPRPHAHGERVATLRAKLDRLDDITDSSRAFKIEREIYELERQTITDEWPEVICERNTDEGGAADGQK